MIDLNDRRLASQIVDMIDRRVEQKLRSLLGVTRYGTVVGAPDTEKRQVAVRLLGQDDPSPGFVYGEVVPVDGDNVRVTIDPKGDRFIDAVLGRSVDALSLGPDGTLTLPVTSEAANEGAEIVLAAAQGNGDWHVDAYSNYLRIFKVGVIEYQFGTTGVSFPGGIATDYIAANGQVQGATLRATANGAPGVYVGDDALIADVNVAHRLGIYSQTTPAEGGLILGNGGDVNLYRGAANVLKTDDAFDAPKFVNGIQSGWVDVTASAAIDGTAAVTFPGTFSSTPNVVVSGTNQVTRAVVAKISNGTITTSGFTVIVSNVSGSAWTGTVRVYWIAVAS